MPRRRQPRPVWLPALVLWAPLSAAGLWLMAGIRLRSTRVGAGEWSLRFVLPAPTDWFATPAAVVGAALLVLGIVLWALAFMQPDPSKWYFVAARHPEFALAGHLLVVAALLSVVRFTSHAVRADVGGFVWRAIADVRSVPNLVVAGVLAALAIAAYVLSFGRPQRLWT